MKTSIQKARALRSNLTDAEQLLWRRIRFRQIDGCKFRRQRPMGPYIVDFVCLEAKLIIEVDGGQHANDKAYDATRDQWLITQGYRVFRFWNNEVVDNIEGVAEKIYQTLKSTPFLHPSPQGGRKKIGEKHPGQDKL